MIRTDHIKFYLLAIIKSKIVVGTIKPFCESFRKFKNNNMLIKLQNHQFYLENVAVNVQCEYKKKKKKKNPFQESYGLCLFPTSLIAYGRSFER